MSTAALVGAGVAVAAPASAAAYDLVVSDVRPVLTGAQAVGSEVTFKATIKNQGTAATPARVVHGVAFAINGQTVSWNDVSDQSLAPGATRTLTATYGPGNKATWSAAATGSYTLRAWVDDINRIPGEASESNNTRTTTVTTAPLRAVDNVKVTPAVDQTTFERTHDFSRKATWSIPAGQPAGVNYTVVEHAVADYATCKEQTITKGTTAGSALTFAPEAGTDCFGHGYVIDSDYTVVATAASGRPAVSSAYSSTCHSYYYYDAYFHGQQTWDSSCVGGTALHDFVDPIWAFVDAGSLVPQGSWEKDQGFTGGQVYTSAFPDLAPEFNTHRWGFTRYDLPVDQDFISGEWHVVLTFVEPTFKKAGQRVFDVRVNGQLVAKDLDIYAKVGYGKTYVVDAVIPKPNGVVTITTTKKIDNPIVASIVARAQ